MKNYTISTLLFLCAFALFQFNSCKPNCENATGDLSLQALEAISSATPKVGEEFKIRCVIKNLGASDSDCPPVVPESSGVLQIGYSATYSASFSTYQVIHAETFPIKELDPDGEQHDLVPIVPNKPGWYAVKIDLNTGALPVKETNSSNNSKAVAIEVK